MSGQRDNSGVLFKNDRKEADNHPDYEGRCMIDGKEFWMKAWIKDGAKGKFMSFSFKPKEAANNGKQQPKQDAFGPPDEIPF